MSFCKKIKIQEGDPYDIGEESDSDDEMGRNSSEDELEISNYIMQKIEEKDLDSDSEDDFEKEMQRELDECLQQKLVNEVSGASSTTISTAKTTSHNTQGSDDTATTPGNVELYDEDYFSSGSEDNDAVGGFPSKSKQRREVLTNDELFYDPDLDDEDEKWVTKQRQQNANKFDAPRKSTVGSTKTSKSKIQKVPTSDAILSCPACMSTLSIDCQRHEVYKSQYRAMFVMNCEIIKNEILKYQDQRHKHIGKKKGRKTGKLVPDHMERQSSPTSEDIKCEIYHPVKCCECGTEVAVFDSDEVYHFFNVLTSYA